MANLLQQVFNIADRPTFFSLISFSYYPKLHEVIKMFGYLPEAIKQQVLYLLQNDNFRAAKEVYDSWLSNNHANKDNSQ